MQKYIVGKSSPSGYTCITLLAYKEKRRKKIKTGKKNKKVIKQSG